MKSVYSILIFLTIVASTVKVQALNKFKVIGQDSIQAAPADSTKKGFGSYTPNSGFRLADTDLGSMNVKIFTYLRYLNQQLLDDSYTNSFGQTNEIDRRQDIQLNKVNIQFLGWLLDPRFRYLFYVWTNNTAQGQGAQVVVAGNLTFKFNDYFTLGGGINALPGVRSTEGSFPFWLAVDNRMIADEYFRPSYTNGLWAKGKIIKGLDYQLMLGNNMSQLGVDAGQLDDGLNTVSASLVWLPTTGEYGLNNNFGDFEDHQKVATRVGAHFSRSREDRQGQPDDEAFENVQIRISDGSVIFAPGIFGSGTIIDKATYNMTCFDAGAKYKGFSLEGEFYFREVNDFEGKGIDSIGLKKLSDTGFQLQASAMIIKKTLQAYATGSMIMGEYGDPTEFRFGLNWHPWHNHVVRLNAEYIHIENSPVGGLSVPYLVGSTGDIFNVNFVVNF
jgi:hypothetical protein